VREKGIILMNRNVLKYLLVLMLSIALLVSAATAINDLSVSPTKQIQSYRPREIPTRPSSSGTTGITIAQIDKPVDHVYGKYFLYGKVNGVDPNSYEVAVYIYVPRYGWVNKPTWAQPRTIINSDGTFKCSYVTGGHDWDATKFMAFRVPKGTSVPLLYGAPTLPTTLYNYPYASK
jgi:hypothetical protein